MNRNNDFFYVTRQIFFPDGAHGIEITQGIDSASPDALAAKYDEERGGYQSPIDAASAAIELRKKWAQDCQKRVRIYIAGYAPQLGIYGDNPVTPRECIAWGKAKYQNMPKCDKCGEILGGDTYRAMELDDSVFCSQYCAEYMLDQYYREMAEIEGEGEGWQ